MNNDIAKKIDNVAEIGPLLACLIEPALRGGLSEVEADRIYDQICGMVQHEEEDVQGAAGVAI